MRTTWLSALIVLGVLSGSSVLAACGRQPEPDSRAPGNPLVGITSQGDQASERGTHLHGRIAERLPAGGYTYLDLVLADGSQHWVVVMADNVPDTGHEVDVVAMGTRTDFYSRRLGRRFDRLTFVSFASAQN